MAKRNANKWTKQEKELEEKKSVRPIEFLNPQSLIISDLYRKLCASDVKVKEKNVDVESLASKASSIVQFIQLVVIDFYWMFPFLLSLSPNARTSV